MMALSHCSGSGYMLRFIERVQSCDSMSQRRLYAQNGRKQRFQRKPGSTGWGCSYRLRGDLVNALATTRCQAGSDNFSLSATVLTSELYSTANIHYSDITPISDVSPERCPRQERAGNTQFLALITIQAVSVHGPPAQQSGTSTTTRVSVTADVVMS